MFQSHETLGGGANFHLWGRTTDGQYRSSALTDSSLVVSNKSPPACPDGDGWAAAAEPSLQYVASFKKILRM